jgi:hypothetical protein
MCGWPESIDVNVAVRRHSSVSLTRHDVRTCK